MAMRSRLSSSGPRLALVVLAGLGTSARAAPQHCPDQIKVEQHTVGLPAGLRAFDSEPRHNWVNAQFSDGSPDEQAWLAPDSTRRSGASITNVWRFAPAAGGTWLACGYTGTSLVVAFRLADTIRTCEVRYDANTTPPSATAVDCR
jgi:hypothetical protein